MHRGGRAQHGPMARRAQAIVPTCRQRGTGTLSARELEPGPEEGEEDRLVEEVVDEAVAAEEAEQPPGPALEPRPRQRGEPVRLRARPRGRDPEQDGGEPREHGPEVARDGGHAREADPVPGERVRERAVDDAVDREHHHPAAAVPHHGERRNASPTTLPNAIMWRIPKKIQWFGVA